MREIGDFEPLLQNVAKDGEYKICSWIREGKTLEESIPALFDRAFVTEGELLNWNIMIVSDDRECYADNPFDGSYDDPNDEGTKPVDYNLNEIAKMLGVVPAHSVSTIDMPAHKKDTAHYNISVDSAVRDNKLQQYMVEDFTRPQRIYLLAVQKKYDVDVSHFSSDSMVPADTHEVFSTKGYYPPNCRFLKFNLSSNSNRTTMTDYFRLWMTVMSLAYNDGADELFIAPYLLYSVDTDIDKDVVCTQITEIYSRIHYVRKFAENQISHIHKLREYQDNKHYDIPYLESSVKVSFEADEEGLYLNNRRFGLAKNCPVPDEPEYSAQREQIEKNIKEYLKIPRRAVKRSVGETKRQGEYVSDIAEFIHLDPDQIEDLDESIDNIELELMKAEEIDINYPKENAEQRKKADKHTKKVMKNRSTAGAVVLGSIAMFSAFALAFMPYIIDAIARVKTSQAISGSLMVVGICVAILALCGIITLIVLKMPLSSALHSFRDVIDALVDFVNNQADAYSEYLSKLSGFMKRNSFKRYLNSDVMVYMRDEEDMYILNRNYCEDIEQTCKKWSDGFRFRLLYKESGVDADFVLDNNPRGNSVYSFVLSDGIFKMDYNNYESRLETPYEFVKSLNVKREEVYSCRNKM